MLGMIARAPGATYEDLRRQFDWDLPPRFNMGVACADQQPSDAPALIEVRPDGSGAEYSFGELANLSSRLANGLRSLGIGFGDRVGVVLPQRVETGLAHLAVWKLGAISVPMTVLFGPQALTYRLGDSAAKAVITDREHLETVAGVAAETRRDHGDRRRRRDPSARGVLGPDRRRRPDAPARARRRRTRPAC